MSRPWMPWYVGDYLAKTSQLSLPEHGSYCLLKMHYWTHGNIPNDDERVRVIARMSEKDWKRSRDVIAALFAPGWVDPDIVAEIMLSESKYEKRVAAGRAGGEAKAQRLASAKQNTSIATETPSKRARRCGRILMS